MISVKAQSMAPYARFSSGSPTRWNTRALINLNDDTVLSSTVLDSHNLTHRDEIQRRFRTLTADLLSRRRQESIIEATANLDRLESMSELTRLLRNLALPVLKG